MTEKGRTRAFRTSIAIPIFRLSHKLTSSFCPSFGSATLCSLPSLALPLVGIRSQFRDSSRSLETSKSWFRWVQRKAGSGKRGGIDRRPSIAVALETTAKFHTACLCPANDCLQLPVLHLHPQLRRSASFPGTNCTGGGTIRAAASPTQTDATWARIRIDTADSILGFHRRLGSARQIIFLEWWQSALGWKVAPVSQWPPPSPPSPSPEEPERELGPPRPPAANNSVHTPRNSSLPAGPPIHSKIRLIWFGHSKTTPPCAVGSFLFPAATLFMPALPAALFPNSA
jgi:hypothetical protein